MPARRPLSTSLDTVFSVQEALDAEHRRTRLRAADLAAPYRGVRRRRDRPAGPLDVFRDLLPTLHPGDRFSHLSAARIWGVPLATGGDDRLHVSTSTGSRSRQPGVVGHRTQHGTAQNRRGLPVSAPATLFLELAACLPLDELVVTGDHLVLDPAVLDPQDLRPWLTRGELGAATACARGRGAPRAREAAELVRVGAESRMETLLRLLLVRAGLPEPDLNPEILDRHGRLIGRFDLVWHRQRVIAEYDGDQHRTSRAQYERDVRRHDRAADEGWRSVRVRASGVLRRHDETVSRVARALRR